MQNKMINNNHIAAYLRDSGGGEQDLSLPQQEAEVRRWCEEKQLTLTKIFRDEATPGSSTIGRDGFLEMIRYFRSLECKESGIVLWKYSRFARDIDDAQFYRADLRRRGFQIYSIKDTIPDGLNGRFFEAAIDWMNARFLEDLSSDVKRGLQHLVQNYGAMPGIPPRGYKREPINIGKRRDGTEHVVSKWVPDPETWERCKMAWKMRARGENYRRIHEVTGLFKSKNSYTDFFRNEIYLGRLKYGDVTISVEPLIDDKTWDAVQKLNKANQGNNLLENSQHPRRSKSHFLLSGKAYCAKCGGILNGEVVRFKGKTKYEYYACSHVQRNMDCDARKIPKHTLETAVIKAFQDYMLKPVMLLAMQDELAQDIESKNINNNAQIIELERKLTGIKRKINNITDLLAEHGPDDQSRSLLIRLNSLESKETQIINKISELDIKHTDTPKLSNEQLKKLIRKLKKLMEAENRETQRKILHGFIEKVTVERDGKIIRGMIEFRYPPDDKFMRMVTGPVEALYHRHKIISVELNFPITKHP